MLGSRPHPDEFSGNQAGDATLNGACPVVLLMYEAVVFALAGAFGAFVRCLVTGKGLIMLPKKELLNENEFINLGFLAPTIIGVAAGIIAPHSLGVDAVISVLAGYVGHDFIENAIERALGLPERGG